MCETLFLFFGYLYPLTLEDIFMSEKIEVSSTEVPSKKRSKLAWFSQAGTKLLKAYDVLDNYIGLEWQMLIVATIAMYFTYINIELGVWGCLLTAAAFAISGISLWEHTGRFSIWFACFKGTFIGCIVAFILTSFTSEWYVVYPSDVLINTEAGAVYNTKTSSGVINVPETVERFSFKNVFRDNFKGEFESIEDVYVEFTYEWDRDFLAKNTDVANAKFVSDLLGNAHIIHYKKMTRSFLNETLCTQLKNGGYVFEECPLTVSSYNQKTIVKSVNFDEVTGRKENISIITEIDIK